MAGTNEILPFGLNTGANVASQTVWSGASERTNGFTTGVADSTKVNKAWRQATFMAHVLAQWAVDQSGGSILDNGDIANAKGLLTSSVQAVANALLSLAGYATTAALNAAIAGVNTAVSNEAVLRAQADAAENSVRSTADAGEAAARAAAVTAEANARVAADANLQNLMAPISAFTSSPIAGGGYLKLPTNWVVPGGPFPLAVFQWKNQAIATGNGDTVTFPIAFPNAVFIVVPFDFFGPTVYSASASAVTLTGFAGYLKNSSGAYTSGQIGFITVGW
jgi:hypothetical protein